MAGCVMAGAAKAVGQVSSDARDAITQLCAKRLAKLLKPGGDAHVMIEKRWHMLHDTANGSAAYTSLAPVAQLDRVLPSEGGSQVWRRLKVLEKGTDYTMA